VKSVLCLAYDVNTVFNTVWIDQGDDLLKNSDMHEAGIRRKIIFLLIMVRENLSNAERKFQFLLDSLGIFPCCIIKNEMRFFKFNFYNICGVHTAVDLVLHLSRAPDLRSAENLQF
jgi:hypothetical protein